MNVQTQVFLVLLVFYPCFLILGIIFACGWRARRKSRAPSKDKLLRPPGETLRLRLQEFDDNLTGSFLAILLYGPISCVAFALYVKGQSKSPHLLAHMILFQVVVIAGAVIFALKEVAAFQRNRNDSLGFRGERAVGEELNKLMLDGCLVYHDVPGEGAWNVDHVVVAPTGVYAIETKTRSKDKCPKDRKDYEVAYDGRTLQYPNWNDTHGIDQAKANAKWLAKHLSNALAEQIKATPILTLPGWFVTSSVRPSGSELRVLNHKQIRSVIIDGRTPVLDDKRIQQIGYQLELKCRDVEF